MIKRNILWWIAELVIWYVFIYICLFSINNPINIGGISLLLLFLATLGLFASPLTRHLSIWNKIIDEIVKKEEEAQKY